MADGQGAQNTSGASNSPSLQQICTDMIDWEEAGAETAPAFKEVLHPQLRFRRANGDIDTLDDFIGKLGSGANQGRTLHGEVDVWHYETMAVAGLVVELGDARRFRNIRVFLRGGPRGWQLITWCNEPIKPKP